MQTSPVCDFPHFGGKYTETHAWFLFEVDAQIKSLIGFFSNWFSMALIERDESF